MPRGRMQHTAALPRGKSCSAYAANAIASAWKKNFTQTFFRLPKLWNKIGELGLIFFSNWLIPFWNSLLTYHIPRSFFRWDRQFADRIFRPRSIERHATAKPTQRPHILVAWRNFCRTGPCRCVPRGIVWTHLTETIFRYDFRLSKNFPFSPAINRLILDSQNERKN